MDNNEIIRLALLTMPLQAVEAYAGTVWREAVLSGIVTTCGHSRWWVRDDAEGFSFCAMCKVLDAFK